ncbi:MAG TPA: hydrogenase expression/formation protein HypE [Verrucomicrobiae bacterium]|nr:hydrogenase expression/formation protein HypE [Verrucomicrobiae bacterium]
MAHGSGGRVSHQLVHEVFQAAFDNEWLRQMGDAAILPAEEGRLALTTDSFVVSPVVFRGGDIGKLAVCGTVNDLAVSGAIPKYLTAGFIIEEGFPLAQLAEIAGSMAKTAKEAGVCLVAGDTKVVEKGSADKIFINTTGVGIIPHGRETGPAKIKPGDKIIISGTLGDHGIAIMSEREGLSFTTPVASDCAPLNNFIESFMVPGVKCMRDPTRGGLATTLNELAGQAKVGMVIQEESIPVLPAVNGACGMLGLDPLYLANEGKVIVIVDPHREIEVIDRMRQHPLGKNAQTVGEVLTESPGLVLLETVLGARRILGMLEGEHLPRIC